MASDREPAVKSLRQLARAEAACTRCQLYKDATQAVPGEGPNRAPFMLVGEQPGDKEDLAGKPFVGPAGRMLDQALHDAGIAREETFVTNAVKHFKHETRGKRRLHKRPNNYEVERCKIWLDWERNLVKPSTIVALGVTAAHSLTGRTVTIGKVRGKRLALADGTLRRCCGSRMPTSATPRTAALSPTSRRPQLLGEAQRKRRAEFYPPGVCAVARGAFRVARPACVSASPICCMRLIKSAAAAGGNTRRHAGYRRPVIGAFGLISSRRVTAKSIRSVCPSNTSPLTESTKVSARSGRSTRRMVACCRSRCAGDAAAGACSTVMIFPPHCDDVSRLRRNAN
jgi:uracil-DNA glycosylase